MKKNNLDEMQMQRRDKIGNQSFLLLLYLLLIDTGLYGFGFRWIAYPANIVILLTVCSGIYVIRLIKGNAYVGPVSMNRKSTSATASIVIGAIAAGACAAVTVFILSRYQPDLTAGSPAGGGLKDAGAPILFLVPAIALIIAGITAAIRRIQNKKDDE
ncbi:DUF6773 family protein [Sinanaerobacter chloroacetimidivorans]|jgi:hypothetical protein|uniref:Uncharacterized protein n=1 Tax=Sinanaerobacter chloroacetimidivorans TaxID=2818044 RepID=A0A8J7VXS2_9FIRM|nr:DUF6773 family protein [Sinanaerobacter chloroacetimidivorans]MBR0596999.1 hypothetical protein [Sinanaerobacter chloroacetimidivorans]